MQPPQHTVFVTTCTAAKSKAPGAVPARHRYQGARIDWAEQQANHAGLPLFFLSGVHGLLAAHAPLHWYDHALQPGEVDSMVITVTAQLHHWQVTTVHALLRPAHTPGWAPYHHLMNDACRRAGVSLMVEETDLD